MSHASNEHPGRTTDGAARAGATGFDFFGAGELPSPNLPAAEVARIVREHWHLDHDPDPDKSIRVVRGVKETRLVRCPIVPVHALRGLPSYVQANGLAVGL